MEAQSRLKKFLYETWRMATSGVKRPIGGGSYETIPDLDVAIRALEGIIAINQGKAWTCPQTWSDLSRAPEHVQEAFRTITRYFAEPKSYIASFKTRRTKHANLPERPTNPVRCSP